MSRADDKLEEIDSLDQIPEFASEAEEHEFWSRHSLGEGLLDQMGPLPESELPPPRRDTSQPAFDIFALRDRIVGEYADYFKSFVNIQDPEIEQFVRRKLAEGEPWPDTVLQLNPAYERGDTLAGLAERGIILPETARFFGQDLELHRHQEDAVLVARRGEPYVITTGTGSGKSLTYLIPIFDHVFRNGPGLHAVRAIIVYPMNALINSQLAALQRLQERNWPDSPVVRFARYTGQEDNEARRAIREDPPHVLLTNYVMLEYMLLRPQERPLVQQATRQLQFLVMDEMHVYRGRQGADVAMLMRRMQQRSGNPRLQFVGTSATLSTQGTREERNAKIADVGSTLFGVPVTADNVVDETLQRIAQVPAPRTAEALSQAVRMSPPTPNSVASHPLLAWLEETFGVRQLHGRLIRQRPTTFRVGLDRLVRETGLDRSLCEARLKAVLQAGNAAISRSGEQLLPFRLHQFLASGSSVYATLAPPGEQRHLTTNAQFYAPEAAGGNGQAGSSKPAGRRLLFPLAFCRECGQEYHLVSRAEVSGRQYLLPRSPLLNPTADDTPGAPGFFAIEREALWAEDEELPEFWFQERKGGPQVSPRYQPHVPVRCWVRPGGEVSPEPEEGAVEGWFQARPLMLCLRCRTAYDLRQKSDFTKLATLSQTGRSTATTITSSATVVGLRSDPATAPDARKLLSFTDNRQDASLQAGHLNDFVQVALLRGALTQALHAEGGFGFERVGYAALQALALEPEDFMGEPRATGPGYERARGILVGLLQYRAFEDLRRTWRVAQPNLEQCGLLRIEYEGLAELARDPVRWADVPLLSEVPPAQREEILRAVLDHLRRELAIDAECLDADQALQLVQRANNVLREPWTIDQYERLRTGTIALLPGSGRAASRQQLTIGLGWRSAVGRYLRSGQTWGMPGNLSPDQADQLVLTLVERLRGDLLTVREERGEPWGVQIMAGALRWLPGDGRSPGPDRVRARSLRLRRSEMVNEEPNRYFERLYRDGAAALKGVRGREHTGQVSPEDRIEREEAFRQGKLAALYCSPTMELGVDIADLSVVHMRNVPPTPANYAQRSGRAGRGGKPALVLAFCSQGNAHDEHFFRRKEDMIAGSISPARIDLANMDLVEAHLHAVWLSFVGLPLGSSMDELLDLDHTEYPLRRDKQAQLQLNEHSLQRVVEMFEQVVGEDPRIADARWYTREWLRETVVSAPSEFDRAFGRWRELYKSAIEQRDQARRISDSRRTSRDERRRAEQREQEAKREIELLLNQSDRVESDFYPYRYLAGEGFLPGYNFPRLPLRALVSRREQAQSIDRPRFLGLTEFGPGNVIYHEGRKHRVVSCVTPAGGLESRIRSARLCRICGYIFAGEEATAHELCTHCGSRLEGNSDFPQRLLDQPTVRTQRWQRINSDEEERSREGYRVTTHYRFTAGETPSTWTVVSGDGEALMELLYAPQAQLWRINHGWRRSHDQIGFTIDPESGRWGSSADVEAEMEEPDGVESQGSLTGVKPYVTDNRNILLLRPLWNSRDPQAFLTTLAYALQRGIQFVYQVEEREVEIELIGEGDHRRLLLWEAAEGGTGVWERMLTDQQSLAHIAREALYICHFHPETGHPYPDWQARCAVGCYDCLLSYSNQPDHRLIDRHKVREYLYRLAGSQLRQPDGERGYEEQYRWLRERIDQQSELVLYFLDYLFQQRLRLPDMAQHSPVSGLPVQSDVYYHRDGLPGICVFVAGAANTSADQVQRDRQLRDDLEDMGYRVIVIRGDEGLQEQVARYSDVFDT